MSHDDEAQRRWRAANRVPGKIAHTDASRAAMDDIRARVVARDRPAPRLQRSGLRVPTLRRGVALSWVVGVLAVSGATAATVALTSSTVDGAAGSCQTLRNATASVPYPVRDGAWRNWVLLFSLDSKLGTTLHQACDDPSQRHVDKGASAGTSVEAIAVYQGEVAKSAFCAWSDAWLYAERAGNTRAAGEAAQQIAGALHWPASRGSDPDPRSGLGFGLGWFIPAQNAVDSNDQSEVASMFMLRGPYKVEGTCVDWRPPAHSKNGTVVVLRSWQHA